MRAQRLSAIVAICLVVVVAAAPALADSPPVVTSVVATPRADGSGLVDIRYNLADADGDACTISIQCSTDNGVTWTSPIRAVNGHIGAIMAVSGHIGVGIKPGSNRLIVWNSGVDRPGYLSQHLNVHVIADDGGRAPSGMALIPAGEYLMGDHHDRRSYAPVHAVYVDAFYMDTHEVTNQQYAAALNWALGQGLIYVSGNVVYGSGNDTAYCNTVASSEYSRITWSGSTFGVTSGKADHPMAMVSWYGAAMYANWRSGMNGRQPAYDPLPNQSGLTWACKYAASGYRLPSEAEWEKAARGGLHNSYRRYPWGDTLGGSNANYWASGDPYESKSPRTTPVGYYAANGYGLYDMAGNAREWCNDWYSPWYYRSSPHANPRGPGIGKYRVLRGGGWLSGHDRLRCAHRDFSPPSRRDGLLNYGFRLALDPE